MRLTATVLAGAPAALNAVDERELMLRGLKIPAIENLGVTQDKYEALDLTDNEITKLDNIPSMHRLQSIYLANNQISRIAADLGPNLPRLETLVLTNNRIAQLGDIDALASIQSLLLLSLLHNPVTRRPHYRAYVIHRFPRLRTLDFEKIKRAERIAAAKFFASKAGKAVLEEVARSRVIVAIGGPPAGGPASAAFAPAAGAKSAAPSQFSPEQLAALQEAIAAASSAEEVDRIRASLEAGVLPEQAAMRLSGGAAAVAAALADAPIPSA